MKWLSRIRSNPNLAISLVSWALFLSCGSGLICMGYQCVEKYLSYPTAIDISNYPKHEYISQLAFTFQTFPSPLNIINLKKCGLTYSDVKNGQFVGKGSPECEDPEKFWDLISLKMSDFGLKNATIYYFDGEMESKLVSDLEWKIDFVNVVANSLTVNFPKSTKDISLINIDIDPNLSLILLHSS